MWFTEADANKIGRITTAGTITEFRVRTSTSEPLSIVLGPDGALWFTEYNRGQIGRITVEGAITEFPTPTRQSTPYGLAVGGGSVLWFTEDWAGKVGRIRTDGSITETGAIARGPKGIVALGSRTIWFVEYDGNSIDVISFG